MKNLLVFLMAFAVIGTASATTVTNGEFTVDNADWNYTGASFSADHNTAGGNPNGFTILRAEANGGWGIAYQVGLEDFNELGIPPGWGVTLQCDVKALSGTSSLEGAYLKIETWAATYTLGGPEVDISPVTTDWATYSIDYTSDAGGIGLKCILITKWETGFGATDHGFDNVEILVRGGTPALRPVPINNAGALTTTPLSWENSSGTTSVDVYLLDCNDPCTSPDPRGSGLKIVDGLDVESVTVSLAEDKHYYWVVDEYGAGDYNDTGFIWYFQTQDSPPDVNAGADQYLVATASPMDVNLDATVTEDNPGETYAWTDITVAADKDPATTVTINTPTTEDTTVTLTNTVNGTVTGWYQFTLTVTDSNSQVTADSITVGVYDTCAEAATEDPGDAYDDTADSNGDCKKDLKDLALLGAFWLDCNANRIACP